MNTHSMDESFQHLFSDVKSNPYLIPLPENNKDSKIKYIKYIVDSRDRNISKHPSPSSYEIILLSNILDVVSLELMLAEVPFSRYLIHSNNNTLHFNTSEITIENGDYEYDITKIINALNTQFTSAGADINVTLNANNNKLKFTSTSAFTLNFEGESITYSQNNTDIMMKKNSIGRLLGFEIKNYTSVLNNGQHEIVTPYPFSIATDNYIIMRLNRAKVYTANDKPADDCFAIIHNRTNGEPSNDYVSSVVKNFNPPLASFEKLNISFYDYYGNKYDFNNKDHHLELKFGILKEGRRI